jgi:hypothetical protein
MVTRSRTERGQALIIIVFAIIALFGMTALAVDGGNAYADRRRAQNAADTAALSGALARIKGDDWVGASVSTAAENGYNNDGSSNAVQVFSPPISGPNSGDIEYIQVRITSHIRTFFASIVGMRQITNVVEAVSRTKTPEYTQMFGGALVVSLAPTSDCMVNRALWIHGEATLDLAGGGVFSNSNNDKCALITEGSGSIRIKDGQVSLVGQPYIQKPKLITPYPPSTGAVQLPYPPPYFMPKVGCSRAAVVSPDGSSMSSGSWDEEFPPKGVHSLGPGTYCLNADFVLNAGELLEGHSVTFKMEHGDIHFNGDADFKLSAPTGGDNAGLLIYVPIENKSRIALNGGADARLVGTILAPGSFIRLNGSDNSTGWRSQIIGYTVEVTGNSKIVLVYKDEQNYDALTMPELQFTR